MLKRGSVKGASFHHLSSGLEVGSFSSNDLIKKAKLLTSVRTQLSIR